MMHKVGVTHTNIGKPLELRVVRVIYRVGQITHRAITTNKMDLVIVTMHASKLKTKQEQKI
jgi:adenylosuccinate synthase